MPPLLTRPFTILLVDDHAIFADGVVLALAQKFRNATVLYANNEAEALKKLDTHPAHIILLDIGMPGSNGIEIAEQMLAERADQKIIVLTQHTGDAMIAHLLRLGVKGFVFKNEQIDLLFNAIEVVMNGDQYVSDTLQKRILRILTTIKPPSVIFTKREAEILIMLRMGKSSKEIATRLSLATSTINSCRDSLLRRTNTKNVAELIAFTYENGIVA